MKQIRRMIVIFILFMLFVLYGFISISAKFKYKERDIAYYNDLLYRIEEEYIDGVDENDIERRYGCNIIMSKEMVDEEAVQVYRDNSLVLDFTPAGEYIGKIAWADNVNRFNDSKRAFMDAAIMMWLLVFAAVSIIIIFTYKSLIKPVNELVDFSKEMAKGNLDNALPIHRDNLFGSFVEAFDIMREELKESRKREMEAEIARKELVTQLSHDIKTPLAVIKATCEVLELKLKDKDVLKENKRSDENNSDDIVDKIELISRKADTVSALMNNVMHATLEELDHIEVNVKEEDSTIIEDLIGSFKNYGNIIVEGHVPHCLVYMDRLRMEQVIENIVGNSYKYAGTDIVVSFSESEDITMADGNKGRFIKIAIRDSGPGVNEDELALIAEKYYRGKNSSEQNGYGLGLYLVRLYMEKQGGGIEYYNDNGFVVELLLRKV